MSLLAAVMPSRCSRGHGSAKNLSTIEGNPKVSNIVSIGLPRRPNKAQRQAGLLQSFAVHRRSRDDVYWLKENAEALNVMATSGARMPDHALAVYQPFYDTIEDRIRFFPQYYRFLLSICLDLEDLGIHGRKGAALCQWVRASDLAASELSDLQRAEAERLLTRRLDLPSNTALRERLLAFASHSQTFALPNKKAAYELTHILFYLSDYGQKPVDVSDDIVTSLEFAGLLAYLDQDVDLLAEVCTALRFASQRPSQIWEDMLAAENAGFSIHSAPDGAQSDAYHEYLVTSWWAEIAGVEGFCALPVSGGMEITRQHQTMGPLRVISEMLYHLGSARSADWHHMRSFLDNNLEAHQSRILNGAAQSTDRFDQFFAQFSRVPVRQ